MKACLILSRVTAMGFPKNDSQACNPLKLAARD
jgi:hypothetical protein